jgi:uncharacterized repeat protein (TIGR01451 family)/fimbrial isopeptide formation D2 family protein
MNKKLFFTFALAFALLTSSISYANYSNGASKPGGITNISHPTGLGASHNDAQFNRYTDSRLLAALRGHGFYEVDLPGANNCAVSAPGTLGIPATSNVPGIPYPPGVNNTTAAYPFFDLNCMNNHLGTNGANGGNASHLDERDFLSVRVCPNGNCGSEPVLTGADSSGNCSNGVLQRGGQNADMLAWARFNSGGNTYWYPGTQPICNKNFTNIPQYEHAVDNLDVGDRVRFFVYIHNSAQEFDAGSTQHQQTVISNTDIEFDWSNIQNIQATLVGTNNNGGATSLTDITSLQYAQTGLTIEPVSGSIIRRGSGATGGFTYISSQANLDIPMGVVASSYGNVQLAYIDFDIVQAPLPNFNIIKTATQNGQALTDGDIVHPGLPIRYSITVTNNGTVSGNGPILTDTLPINITYVGGATGNVTNNDQDVSLDFSGINFDPNTTQTFSFDTQYAQDLGTPFCNEVFLAGVLQDSICLEFGVLDLTVTKSVDVLSPPGTVVPGQTLTYTFTVTNTGNMVMIPTDIFGFIDPIDAINLDPATFTTTDTELTYISATNTVLGNISGTTIQPGQSITLSFSIDVSANAVDGTVICNPDIFDPANGISNQVCVTVEGPDLPIFEVIKTAFNVTTGQALVDGDTINEMDTIRYDITTTNTGTGTGNGPIIIDTLAPQLVYVRSVTPYINYLSATNDVELLFNTNNFQPGESATLSFEVQLDLNNPTVIDGLIFCNPDDVNNSDIDNQICLTTSITPSFEVIKGAQNEQGDTLITGGSVQQNDNIIFSFTVNNTGSTNADGPIFTDQLDQNFDWNTFSSTHDFVTISPSGLVTFDLSEINFEPDMPQDFTFLVAVINDVSANTQICNPANPFDPNDSIIMNQLCFIVTDSSGVILTKGVFYPTGHPNAGNPILPPALLNPGDEIVYRITAINTTNALINNITVIDDLPDDVLHIQNITNNINTAISSPPTAGPLIIANFGPLSGTTSQQAEVLVRIVNNPSTTQICNQATVTQIDGQVPQTVIMTGPDDACVSVDPNGGGSPNITLSKTIEDENGQYILPQPGDYFYYRVTATNSGDATGDPFVASDMLPQNITWSPDLGGAAAETSYSAITNTVSVQFGAISSDNGTETYRFRVQLATDASRTEYCNVVTANNENIAAAEVCFDNTTTPGSGGGPGSNPTVGVCFRHPTGAWGCEKRYPDWSPDDPDYVKYAECVAAPNDKDFCLNDWVISKGFHTCTPGNSIPVDHRMHGVSPIDRVKFECEEKIIVKDICNPEAKIDISVKKNVLYKDIASGSDPAIYIQDKAKIVYDTDDINEIAYKNICKEKIYYRIEVEIEAKTEWQNAWADQLLEIDTAVLNVYDFITASEFGSLGDRSLAVEMAPTSTVPGFDEIEEEYKFFWDKDYSAFRKKLNKEEIMSLLSGGKVKYTITYSVQSDLIKNIDQDESTVSNTAFAVLDFNGELSDEQPDGTRNVTDVFDITDPQTMSRVSNVSKAGMCDIALNDLASLGDSATTKIRIFRPFAQTRGGADYGGTTLTQIDTTETNKYTSGAQFAEKLTEINTFMSEAKENFYEFLAKTATVSNARFGIFRATPKNDGTYYLNLAEKSTTYYALPSTFVTNRSETFVIERRLVH